MSTVSETFRAVSRPWICVGYSLYRGVSRYGVNYGHSSGHLKSYIMVIRRSLKAQMIFRFWYWYTKSIGSPRNGGPKPLSDRYEQGTSGWIVSKCAWKTCRVNDDRTWSIMWTSLEEKPCKPDRYHWSSILCSFPIIWGERRNKRRDEIRL